MEHRGTRLVYAEFDSLVLTQWLRAQGHTCSLSLILFPALRALVQIIQSPESARGGLQAGLR
jgi:hypothetical protein